MFPAGPSPVGCGLSAAGTMPPPAWKSHRKRRLLQPSKGMPTAIRPVGLCHMPSPQTGSRYILICGVPRMDSVLHQMPGCPRECRTGGHPPPCLETTPYVSSLRCLLQPCRRDPPQVMQACCSKAAPSHRLPSPSACFPQPSTGEPQKPGLTGGNGKWAQPSTDVSTLFLHTAWPTNTHLGTGNSQDSLE